MNTESSQPPRPREAGIAAAAPPATAAARFPEATAPIWLARFRHIESDPAEMTLVAVTSDAHPDGALVDMPLVGPGLTATDVRLAQIRFVPSTRVVRRIRVFDALAPGAPPMIYTEATDSTGQFLSATVIAYAVPHDGSGAPALAEGAMLDSAAFAELGLSAADQIGAVQWWPHNGQITQLYVAPSQRRRKVASKIVGAAEAVSRSRGGQPVRGGGERTELGDAFTTAAPQIWRHRVADLTVVRPPMTPEQDAEGIAERNLEVRP